MWNENKTLFEPQKKSEEIILEDYYFKFPGEFSYSVVDDDYACASAVPHEDVIHEIYSNYYTHVTANSKLRTILDGLVRSVFSSSVLGAISRLTPLYSIVYHLNYGIKGGGYKILDYGCGNGEQSRFVKPQNDWIGFDFDPTSADAGKAKGYTIFTDIEALRSKSEAIGGFDYIIMSHILEHVTDPLSTLEKVSELLSENGEILVYTPNMQAFGRALVGKYWRGYEAPRHFHIFSPKSLSRLIENSQNLKISTVTSTTRGNRNFMIAYFDLKGFPRILSKLMAYFYQYICWSVSILFSNRAGEELFAVIKRNNAK
ncbi:class I SAM-dependent methyltransferase [Paracoccaceae bacterium]|nr:class I SAM-dependent methyltransferase [Paracoccaceae bacterium]